MINGKLFITDHSDGRGRIVIINAETGSREPWHPQGLDRIIEVLNATTAWKGLQGFFTVEDGEILLRISDDVRGNWRAFIPELHAVLLEVFGTLGAASIEYSDENGDYWQRVERRGAWRVYSFRGSRWFDGPEDTVGYRASAYRDGNNRL